MEGLKPGEKSNEVAGYIVDLLAVRKNAQAEILRGEKSAAWARQQIDMLVKKHLDVIDFKDVERRTGKDILGNDW